MDVAAMDTAATFCATLVDEWRRAGVVHAVVAPGSRSTPLLLALRADGRLRLDVFVDERSAAFFALGTGLAT
ncbi:MAG TPA: thiamine pyrophosphate-binding protein, partial [Acidimicrobiales bacterium]|nr:thiamine pyrophosphate-binding protein [Acidimicrobiales bacterium]